MVLDNEGIHELEEIEKILDSQEMSAPKMETNLGNDKQNVPKENSEKTKAIEVVLPVSTSQSTQMEVEMVVTKKKSIVESDEEELPSNNIELSSMKKDSSKEKRKVEEDEPKPKKFK